MKNKIMGLFMMATVSMISMGGCNGCDSDKGSKSTSFTSIEVKSNKALEADVILKFEKGTKLDGYYIKFEGSAVVNNITQANGKGVNNPVKLVDLGTAGDDELLFKITGLTGAEKITVSLVKGDKYEAVKGKDGNTLTYTDTVKAAVKPMAEFTKNVVINGQKASLYITFKNLSATNEEVKNYKISFDKEVKLENDNNIINPNDTIKLDTNSNAFVWDKDNKVLEVKIVASNTAQIICTLTSSDKDKFEVGPKATETVNIT